MPEWWLSVRLGRRLRPTYLHAVSTLGATVSDLEIHRVRRVLDHWGAKPGAQRLWLWKR